jgi:hypothetical protein
MSPRLCTTVMTQLACGSNTTLLTLLLLLLLLLLRCCNAQAQATALVSNFHCPPVVESVLRQLWLSLLPATQLLEPDFARDPSSHSR